MPRVSTYLNFMGNTEEAFTFYKAVFGTEFASPIMRMGEMRPSPGAPRVSDAEQHMVMHVELPILAGHVLMGTDMLESMGHERRLGNSVTINLELEDRAETERLFGLLSDGGSDVFGLADMPWGAYWGTCADCYGIRWMFNCQEQLRQERNTVAEPSSWLKQGPASYFPSIEKTYGCSIAEWQKVIADCGLDKHMAIVGHLKSEYGMGHGHANALVGWTLAGNVAPE